MLVKVFKDKIIRNFVIIASLLFLTILIFEKINGRFWLNDFKVIYMAVESLLNNEQVYGIPFGLDTGYYKYSPFTLLLFIPYTFFSFNIASIIHFFIIGFCAITTIIVLEKIISKYLFYYRKKNLITLLSVLLCVMLHLVREFHLGNINMILLLLLCLSLKFTLESKPIKSGLLLALVILAKPYFIICILPFLVHKKYKTALSVAVSVMLFVLVSGLIIGFPKSINLYFEWFSAMLKHSNYLSSNHTIFSLFNFFTGILIQVKYSIPLLAIVAIFSCVFFWKFTRNDNVKTDSSIQDNVSLIIHFFLLISVIPNILITDTEHFLFSLPLIAIVILYLTKGRNYLWIMLFVFLIFMYGGNSSDLLGKNLAGKLEDIGLQGISNLIIIGTVIYLYSKNRKIWGMGKPMQANNQ